MNNSEILLKIIQDNHYNHINKVECIINKDKKDDTYKLALLRAFCEISEKDFNNVIWRTDKIGVPVELIVENWILYYWPLFESSDFIPQKNGEKESTGKKIAFRKELTEFIHSYKSNGDLKSKQLLENWENITFSNLVNSIEYTAQQRGWERWEPK